MKTPLALEPSLCIILIPYRVLYEFRFKADAHTFIKYVTDFNIMWLYMLIV